MASSSETTATEAAHLAVAEAWAGFTKAVAIYPRGHDRIRTMAERFFSALGEAAGGDDREGVEVIYYQHGMLVSGRAIKPDAGSSQEWLRERIHRSALAGVEFFAGLSPEDLAAFTERLLEIHGRSDLDVRFEDLWPDSFSGLRLIPRQFEGAFSAEGCDVEAIQRSWGGKGALRLDLGKEQELAELLAGSAAIQERVERIAALIEAAKAQDAGAGERDDPEARSRRMDVVGRIVKLMPAEALRSFRSVVDVTVRMLDGLLDRLGARRQRFTGEPLLDDVLLERLMFITSRIAFGRKGPSPAELAAGVAASSAAGENGGEKRSSPAFESRRARDDAITDDLGAFLEDLKKLGEPEDPRGLLADVELPAEQLGVYLHYLVALEDAPASRRLHPVLARLLRDPGSDELEILAQYLQWRRDEAAPADGHPERLVEFLRAAHLSQLRRECDLVSADAMREQFPRDFGLYLELMDFGNEQDVAELDELLAALGPERLAEAGDELQTLSAETVRKLLAGASRTRMPLAWAILDRKGEEHRPAVVDYARRLKLSAPEACLLSIMSDPYALPVDYLQALLVPPADKESQSKLRHQISSFICAFVRSSQNRPDLVSRRVYAIKFLAKFATRESNALLESLVKRSRWLFIKREPAAVRRAAKQVLRMRTGSGVERRV